MSQYSQSRYPRPVTLVRAAVLVLCGSTGVYLLVVGTRLPGRDPVAAKLQAVRSGDDSVVRKQYRLAVAAYRAALRADPDDWQVRMKLADAYVQTGNYPSGAAEAVRAANLLPGSLDAQLLAGELQCTQQEFEDAAARAASILQDHPDNVRALLISGYAAAMLTHSSSALTDLDEAIRIRADYQRLHVVHHDEEAEAAFRRAVRLVPSDANVQIALGNFLRATGRDDEAEEPLKRAAVLAPDNVVVSRALGRFYLTRHRDAEGEMYLKRAAAQGASDDRLALSDFYIGVERRAEALVILDAMPAKDDALGAVSLRLAQIEFQQGRQVEAMRRVNALLGREPANTRAVIAKVRFLMATRKWDEALRFARVATAQDPKSSDARSLLGQILSVTGDIPRAFDELNEAFRLNPDDPQVPLHLSRLSLELGRDQAAVQFAQDAVRKNPDNREAGVALVKTLVALREYAAAEGALRPLLARYAAAPDVLVQLGAVQQARGNDEAASAAFARALLSDRQSFDALAGLVSLDLKTRRTATAHQRVEEALAFHPHELDYLLLAGRVYAAENNARQGEAMFREALQIDQANENAALSLADLLARQRRPDEARRVLEQLVERRPGSIGAQTSLAMLLERTGHAADARAQYEKIVAHNPRAATASFRLAALYANEGTNLGVALGLAVDAKQQLPDDPAVSDALGWVYTRQNLPDVGLPHLQDAVRGDPENPTYHFHLGSAYQRVGRFNQARDELTRALQIDPNFAQAEQARAALGSLRK